MKVKSYLAVAFALFTSMSALGQGTLTFQSTSDAAHAIPPNSSTRLATGTFTLDPALLFTGRVFMEQYNVSSVTLFRSTSASEVGTMLYDFTPGGIALPGPDGEPGGRVFNLDRTLTQAEATDLEAGFWWITAITPAFPNGEIRGQITLVPEPSTWAMIGVGAAALVAARRRNHT